MRFTWDLQKAKRARGSEEPTQRSLREMPEVDFSAYRVRKNPFAKRIEREGIEIVIDQTVRGKPVTSTSGEVLSSAPKRKG